MLDLHRLRLLREVHLKGSIAEAAKSSSYSPSVISQHLSKLARDLGVDLLVTKDRRATLTDQAVFLLGYVEQALSILEQAEAELQGLQEEPFGSVRLGTLNSIAAFRLPGLFHRISEKYPKVTPHFRYADATMAVDLLVSGALDIAIAEEVKFTPLRVDRSLEMLPIGRERIPAFLPAGYQAAIPPTLEELEGIPWIFEPEGTTAYEWASSCCLELGFQPRVLYTSPDHYTHVRFLEAGVAAAFLPGGLSAGGPKGLTEIDFKEVDTGRELYCLYRKSVRARPAIMAVVGEIERLFDELPDVESDLPTRGRTDAAD